MIVYTHAGQKMILESEYDKLQAALKVAEETLEKLAKLGSEPYYGNSIGNCIASVTLAEIARLKDKP